MCLYYRQNKVLIYSMQIVNGNWLLDSIVKLFGDCWASHQTKYAPNVSNLKYIIARGIWHTVNFESIHKKATGVYNVRYLLFRLVVVCCAVIPHWYDYYYYYLLILPSLHKPPLSMVHIIRLRICKLSIKTMFILHLDLNADAKMRNTIIY